MVSYFPTSEFCALLHRVCMILFLRFDILIFYLECRNFYMELNVEQQNSKNADK